jgi:hypothetical protein
MKLMSGLQGEGTGTGATAGAGDDGVAIKGTESDVTHNTNDKNTGLSRFMASPV